MIGVWNGLRALAGDALIAAGTSLHEQRAGFSEYEAGDFLLSGARLGPAPAGVAACRCACINCNNDLHGECALYCRASIAEFDVLPDSSLLRMAAHVIEGWKPMLVRTSQDVGDLDDFVQALRDRAAQFTAAEADSGDPLLSAADHHAAATFPQHRGK